MKKENFFYTLGLLLIAAALALTLYNNWIDHQAGEATQQALEALQPQLTPRVVVDRQTAPVPTEQPAAIDLPEYEVSRDIPMPVRTVNGYDYIGVLTIGSLGLELPILDRWDYNRLDIAPCCFYGSIYRENMVICGHNYPAHFGTLRNLHYGDMVEFEDVDGNVFHYRVAEIEILPYSALEEMTAGKYALSLFTCDLNRTNRVTVRCELVK